MLTYVWNRVLTGMLGIVVFYYAQKLKKLQRQLLKSIGVGSGIIFPKHSVLHRPCERYVQIFFVSLFQERSGLTGHYGICLVSWLSSCL